MRKTRVKHGLLAEQVRYWRELAVIKGISDVDNARAAIQLYDGSEAIITATVAQTDAFHATASNDATGDFLMPMVGVVPDPFAAEGNPALSTAKSRAIPPRPF